MSAPRPAPGFSHPVRRPFPRVAWKPVHCGDDGYGELVGITPDNTEGLTLTARGFTFWLPLGDIRPVEGGGQ